MYRLTTNNAVVRLLDHAHIPTDPANRDYQEYLAWVAAGNSPEPAPESGPASGAYPQFTALEMLALFTVDEQRAVKQAAMQDVDVGLWYDRMIAATYNTYEDPRVEAGLQALVGAGLLTPERKAEIVQQMQPEST